MIQKKQKNDKKTIVFITQRYYILSHNDIGYRMTIT
jgi:hypothetical protein